MKRILRILAIAAICGILVAPQVEARGSRNTSHSQTAGQRNNGSRGGGRGNGGNRGGGGQQSPSRPSPGHNPGNNSGGGQRPGNNPGGYRPNNPGGQRPGNPGGGGQRPSNPGHQPGHNPGRPMHSTPPPHRPHYASPWSAPRPPHGWRPGRVYPTFSTILGITFGTALNLSLDYLYNNGYNVYSYGNNVVYLSNVNQLNLIWPDATLYYSGGGLDRGEFIYATSYYDTMRYNEAYARLVAAYGAPVSTSYPSNGMQTCWFGYDGRFVTLQYAPGYGADGIMRYYTTLSFGI